MANIPTMSLKTAPIQYNVFNPNQYQAQADDMTLLKDSLAQREARMVKTAEQQSAISTTLGKIRTQLHRDPETDKWFSDYEHNIEKQIQDEADAGNYGNAFRTAIRLAGDVLQDAPVIGRIRANEDFNKEVETQRTRKNNRKINQNTFDWWLANNDYNYSDIKDANGNIIGGTEWSANSTPVDDINWASQAMAAFKLITPDKNDIGRGNNHGTTNADGTGTSGGYSSRNQHERVKIEDIRKNLEELLSSTPDGYRQAEQAFDVAIFDYNRLKEIYDNTEDNDPKKQILKQQLEARNKLMMKNGSRIDYKEYYARMITNNLYAEGLAYDWIIDIYKDSNITDNQLSGGKGRNSDSGNNDTKPPMNVDNWKGANVRQTSDVSLEEAQNAAEGINSLFD